MRITGRTKGPKCLRATLVAALAAMLAALPVAAQQQWTIEAGLFGQRTAFDEGTTLSYGSAPAWVVMWASSSCPGSRSR